MATSMMRRNPFGAIDPVQSRMWDWFTTPDGSTPLSKLFGESGSYVPPVDIYETNEEVLVVASLPGLDAAKADVQVRENQLTLSGEQHSILCFEPEENATAYLQGIPRFGRFAFTFALPCAVEAERAQAKYENGLLCMRFLKAQKHRSIRVAINTPNEQLTAQSVPTPSDVQQITDQPKA